MVDFYTNGYTVGFTLHGWGGFLLITYFIIEMVFLFLTKSLLVHKLVIWLRLRRELKKIIPSWWKVYSVHTFTIDKKITGWQVYVKVVNKINKTWTNDYVIVDWLGRIKSQKLLIGIENEDKHMSSEIKNWKRNKALEDIGI